MSRSGAPESDETTPRVRLRIVMLTSGGPTTTLLDEALARRGVELEAVVVSGFHGAQTYFRRRTLPGTIADAALAPLRWVRRRLVYLAVVRPRYRRIARRVIPSGAMNSERMRGDLAAVQPDLLLLNSTPIIKAPLLETARFGALNGHPALLPWVRGSGVVGWSLRLGVAVGATCHYATPLVDGGPIVARQLLPIQGVQSLTELERLASRLAVDLLADVVVQAVRDGRPPDSVPQTERYPLYRWFNHDRRREFDQLAHDGRAGELFAAWAPLCTDRERWRLPMGAVAAPPVGTG